MSYAMSGSLQAAVYDALVADSVLNDLVGQDVYDAVPTGSLPETYVSIGRERVSDASDKTVNGALHRLDILVITTQPGFAKAKEIAGAISDVLHNADLSLMRGRLVYLQFERAQARRIDTSSAREISLRFRARVEDD